ncbi:hypothetical protein Riv7116_4027 [Rivularia sp. PCC 7116]|uniref:hypothetical protein n=1 Tax=Rivularia sp. PCC 7116 TaxID=373994 RepID=UPI00029EFF8A|nr:hypothetical protein [Rivularia sp. PCC 7116]AFY56467.1 hypothetical protein Riv7116_4027 [Rivularia sp. PCC 7116]
MREKLRLSLSEIAKEDVTQNEREAIIELMMMVMYSDKTLKLTEDEAIKEYASSIEWESPLSLEFYFAKVTPKIRTALSNDEKMHVFLKDINSRIETEVVKAQVLLVCNDLAMADAEFSAEEKDLLKNISQVFQIN